MRNIMERYWHGQPICRDHRGNKALGMRFWLETATLSLLFGGMIGLAIRLTGRETEVIAVALAVGLIKLTSLIAVRQ